MRIALYTNALSTHQIPLAREIVKRVGAENFRYIYTGESGQKFQESHATDEWIVKATKHCWLDEADVVLVGGIRPIELIERRLSNGKVTCYMSERWFKPWHGLPGWLRLLAPSYRKMSRRFTKLFKSPYYRFLPIGPWSKRDMLLMCKLFGQTVEERQIVEWGDFVAPSTEQRVINDKRKVISGGTLKVLWAGRDLAWKRVKDIERAVALANKNLTTIVQLHTSTSTISSPITFTKLTGVTPSEVRAAMRSHDLYVLSSDETEGWGCVVNEALEEGMNVVGTFEAGASAAILPKERLYHAGDVKMLSAILTREYRGELPNCSIGEWTASNAAEKFVNTIAKVKLK